MATVNVAMEISQEDKDRLKGIFGETTPLDDLVLLIGKTGAEELLALAAGRAVFSTVGEIRLYRIFRLLASGMSLSNAEALAPSLFKVTPARARRLVEAAVARYEVELKQVVEDQIKALLDAATFSEDRWEVQLPEGILRTSVLDKAAQTSLADPEPARRGQVWRFPDETYQAVRKAFKLKKRDKPKQ